MIELLDVIFIILFAFVFVVSDAIMDLAAHLNTLSRNELLAGVSGRLSVPHNKRRKDKLISYILEKGSMELLNDFNRLRSDKIDLKRKRVEEDDERRKKARVASEANASAFLISPTWTGRKERWKAFYEATGAKALQMGVCAICGRELMMSKERMTKIPWRSFPGKEKLRPVQQHPAQILFEGCLLECVGMCEENDEIQVISCASCLGQLRSSKKSPPLFSLANGLWIGSIPCELQDLTIPEQKLIALIYSRMHVYKLYPKVYCGEEGLQRALRGSLTSYALNGEKIAAMIAGDLMPRPMELLPAIISVLYVGVNKLPKECLMKLLRVRREKVRRALLWLKKNNPKYYGHVQISEAHLRCLPEDDIPEPLMSIIRSTDDSTIVEEEHGGYVPTEEDLYSDQECQAQGDPDVIPLDISGGVDVELHDATAKDLMSWAFENMEQNMQEGPYVVRHGNKPVCTFGATRNSSEDPRGVENFFEMAFPWLYPYGCGGIEAPRRESVGFREHMQWSLQYHDRRFRVDECFPLAGFAILQRRQAMISAKMRIHHHDAHILPSITYEKLKQAEREEKAGRPPSDEAVQRLKRFIQSSLRQVMGCNEVRHSWRSQIWSTNLIFGPPTLWLTINPSDIHDPIAQLMAGVEIDMDDFLNCVHPSAQERANNIAKDPYAAACFFHFIIETILETLLGIRVTPFQVKSEMGVLGKISAYFGVVESQGRGTLHFHSLLWMQDTPSSDQIQQLLLSEPFLEKIRRYIRANIRAYVPGLESEESIRQIPVRREIAFNRPPNPCHPDYDREIDIFELHLARMEQIHVCKLHCCLIKDRQGRWICKRHAPFPCSAEDYVTADGNWGPKRLYHYVNAWNPDLSINIRCNNDLKILTHGGDTRNIMFYVTSYATKNQKTIFNFSALGGGYKYHLTHPVGSEQGHIQSQHQLLLLRLMNAVTYQQEIAAPMAVAHLMGHGDVYRSHSYSPIYWTMFARQLKSCFPSIL